MCNKYGGDILNYICFKKKVPIYGKMVICEMVVISGREN